MFFGSVIRADSVFTDDSGTSHHEYATAETFAFIDIENNACPRGIDPALIGPQIRSYLSHLGYIDFVYIHCVASNRFHLRHDFDKRTENGLVYFYSLDLSVTVKNADDNIIRRIQRWGRLHPSPSNILLLGGDEIYFEPLLEVYDEQYNVFVACIELNIASRLRIIVSPKNYVCSKQIDEALIFRASAKITNINNII